MTYATCNMTPLLATCLTILSDCHNRIGRLFMAAQMQALSPDCQRVKQAAILQDKYMEAWTAAMDRQGADGVVRHLVEELAWDIHHTSRMWGFERYALTRECVTGYRKQLEEAHRQSL
jgi:hypothetical protein